MTTPTEQVWSRLHTRLHDFVRRRVADSSVADDLVQDIFLRIHTQMGTLSDHDRLESWVFQIARHAVIDHYRRRRTVVPVEDDLLEAPAHGEPDAAAELSASLRDMVEALPNPYREALLLTEYEGLSQVELASRLGLSPSGAKSRVQRARQKIKDELLRCCHVELDRRGRVIDYWERCCCCAGDVSR